MAHKPLRSYFVTYGDVITGDVHHKLSTVLNATHYQFPSSDDRYFVEFFIDDEPVACFNQLYSIQCATEIRPMPDDDTRVELDKIIVQTNAQP